MDRWTNLKVTPGSQTLILAGERAPTAAMASGGPSQLVRSGSDPVLQRLTIVTARPDSTMVYLRADYGADDDRAAGPSSMRTYSSTGNEVVQSAQTPTPLRALPPAESPATRSNLPALRSDPYGSNRGISLYASTQRMSLDSVTAVHVDVHA